MEVEVIEMMVSRGKTINMGDYESERMDISITVRTDEFSTDDLEREIENVKTYLDEKLDKWKLAMKP